MTPRHGSQDLTNAAGAGRSRSVGRLLLIFVTALAVGWVLPRLGGSVAGKQPKASKAAERDYRRGTGFRGRDDLALWVKLRAPELKLEAARYSSHEAELAEWSAEELQAALNEGIRDPACSHWGSAMRALEALLEEWTRRDPGAALAWLDTVPGEAMRKSLYGGLGQGWPAERAAEALDHIMSDVDLRKDGHHEVVAHALAAAAEHGPAAVEDLIIRLRAADMWWPNFEFTFPAGFDFATLLRRPEILQLFMDRRSGNLADAWLRQSPDAAIAGLLALNRATGNDTIGVLFDGLDDQYHEGDSRSAGEQARRLAAKSSELPEDEARALAMVGVQRIESPPGLLRDFIAALPDPGLRGEANQAAARRFLHRDVPTALGFLEAASGDPAERLDQLDALLAGNSNINGAKANGPELRRILASWGCPPERAESLVAKLTVSLP